MKRLTAAVVLSSLVAFSACSGSAAPRETSAAADAPKKKLGIRPNGDTEIQPDMTKIK